MAKRTISKIPRQPCSIDECCGPRVGHGYCEKHYQRFRRHGDPLKLITSAERKRPGRNICAVDSCDVFVKSNSFCSKHYERWKAHGDPLFVLRNRGQGETVEARFWSRVNKNGPTMAHMTTPCWEWIAYCDVNGYGMLHIDSTGPIGAHRAAWFFVKGYIPTLWLLHRCDNPSCVNTDHTREGTPKDNTADMMARGRHHSQKLH